MLEARCFSLSPDSSGVLTHSFRAVTHLPVILLILKFPAAVHSSEFKRGFRCLKADSMF